MPRGGNSHQTSPRQQCSTSTLRGPSQTPKANRVHASVGRDGERCRDQKHLIRVESALADFSEVASTCTYMARSLVTIGERRRDLSSHPAATSCRYRVVGGLEQRSRAGFLRSLQHSRSDMAGGSHRYQMPAPAQCAQRLRADKWTQHLQHEPCVSSRASTMMPKSPMTEVL